MADKALNRGAIEEVGVVFQQPADTTAIVGKIDVQLKLRRVVVQRQVRRLEVDEIEARRRGVLEREHHLEERRPRKIPFGLQLFDEFFERQILMRVGVDGCLAHTCEKIAEARVALQTRSQHQRVDEESDQTLDFGAAAIGDRCPDRDIAASGVASQQRLPRRDERHEQRRAFMAAECSERGGQRRRQFERLCRAVERLHRRQGTIGRQLDRLEVGELLLPVLELPVSHLIVEPLPLPRGIVRVLDRQFGERAGPAVPVRVVVRREILDDDLERPAVDGNVMKDKYKPVLLACDVEQGCPNQRAGAQVERALRFAVRPMLCGCRGIVFTAEIDLTQPELDELVDLLQRLLVDDDKASAQDFVAPDQICEAHLERDDVEIAFELQCERHVVRRAAGFELIQEPETLLGVRNRQRTRARHAPDRAGGRRLGVACGFDARRHRGDSRRFEEAAQRDIDVEPTAHA